MKHKRKILEVGHGIFLREYILEDAFAIFELIEENREHLGQHGENTARKYPTFESVVESIANPSNPKRLRFGIWDKKVLVGSINIAPAEKRTAKIGYWLGEQHQGKGYASRAAWRLIQSVFKTGKIESITASVSKTNSKSTHLLERLGFVQNVEDEENYIYTLDRWLPFYIDAMSYYGYIINRTKWKEVVAKYRGNLNRLKGMRFNSMATKGRIPDFGEGPRYIALPTLGEWARRNGINLGID